MKTGRVAKMFSVDQKTIIQWTIVFPDFFSAAAKGLVSKQRDFNPDDIIVLNTIASYRLEGKAMEEIRVELEVGNRNATLPPEAAVIGADQAIAVYAQLKQQQTELALVKRQLEDSERLRREERETFEQQRQTVQTRIEKLLQEVAVLNYRLEQWEKSDDE
jgi:DNA-binding transcriptional MerR regulator